MSALDSGVIGTALDTDLDRIASGRRTLYYEDGYKLKLQPAEQAAGLTEADIWRFLDEPAAATG